MDNFGIIEYRTLVNWPHTLNKKYASHFQWGQVPPPALAQCPCMRAPMPEAESFLSIFIQKRGQKFMIKTWFLDAKCVGTACCALPEQCQLIVRPRVADFEAKHLQLPGRTWPNYSHLALCCHTFYCSSCK